MKRLFFPALLAALTLVGGCVSQHNVHMEPIQLEPIQVTMDVNVRIQDESAGDEVDAPEPEAAPDGGAANP